MMLEEVETAARWGILPDDGYWGIERSIRAQMVAFVRVERLITNVNNYDQLPKRK